MSPDDGDRCDECGFVYDLAQAEAEAGATVVARADRLAGLLELGGPSDLGHRRRPGVWSPLEYGCHVRDVLLVQRERVLLARRAELPVPAAMGRDERAEHDGYAGQDPAAVARQLRDAAALFANVLARLDREAWDRRLVYSYPARAERSLRWVAAHTAHEATHHLLDVDRQV
jgi:hypothetical protein